MRSLETISNRIHESRRLGHWLNSPPISSRYRGVGAEEAPPMMMANRSGEESAFSPSLPSSPRHTPPGQADTDSDMAESEVGAAPSKIFDSTPNTICKSIGNPPYSEVISVSLQLLVFLDSWRYTKSPLHLWLPLLLLQAFQSFSMEPGLQTTQSKGEQTDFSSLVNRSQHSRSQCLWVVILKVVEKERPMQYCNSSHFQENLYIFFN